MNDTDNTVNALWIGHNNLRPLELLTIKSFLAHGADFHLWTYGNILNIPEGTTVRDGNEILPAGNIFRYPSKMYLNHGAGSLVGFSEIFRYKVLYEKGGWWSDMDVTCLQPLALHSTDYYFRFHGILSVVGNIMKVPPKSELMKLCYNKASVEVNEQQKDWHHAIRILCYYIEYLGLSQHIRYDTCNLDWSDPFFREFVETPAPLDVIPKDWHFIHWMSSLHPKSERGSVLDRLYEQYNCRVDAARFQLRPLL